jgi:signal peptidase I
MLTKIGSIYTLGKSKKVLKLMHTLYRRKAKTLDPQGKERIQSLLIGLQTAILQKNDEVAARMAKQLQETSARLMPKSLFDKARDLVGGIVFALVVAIAIRQMWFEFYTIPTGSMRPTLKEGDYLVVSKTDYGINTPLRSGHFYFDPTLVERGSVVVWTGENMDMPDDSTMYFYVIPGKKQYIKRMIGKPGDTLYFYGGQIYGVSPNGEDLKELRDPDYFQTIEHIPFIRFEGKVEASSDPVQGIFPNVVLYQMNQPVAKLGVNAIGQVQGEMIPQRGHPQFKQYGDLWGFKNYGMSRLLNAAQVEQIHPGTLRDLEAGLLYLEINHHPSLTDAQLIRDEMGRVRPGLSYSRSILPLTNGHVESLMRHMTTSRFTVKNGIAASFGASNPSAYAPKLPNVPDGTYEFQDGVATEVLFSGLSRQLPPDHPLLKADPVQVQTLYNMGFEWRSYFDPAPHSPFPSRYTFFRDGDLHTMSGPLVTKGDPLLTLFLKREYQKQSMSTSVKPYAPFDDEGAPFTDDGSLDIEYIKQYGVTVPDKMYLLLGDNHAMSGDTRLFGFVPQDNLRGSASLLFWPAGSRWGRLPQAIAPHLTIPNLTILLLASGIALGSYLYIQRRYFRPFKFD